MSGMLLDQACWLLHSICLEFKHNPHWLPALRYRPCVDLALTWPLPVPHRGQSHPRGDAGRAAGRLLLLLPGARRNVPYTLHSGTCLPLAKPPPATESLVRRVRSLPITSLPSLVLEVTLTSQPSPPCLWLASSLPGRAGRTSA